MRTRRRCSDYAASVGKTLFACQTLRYNDEYQFAREQFDNGNLGDVYYSEFSLIRRRGVPKWGTFHKKEATAAARSATLACTWWTRRSGSWAASGFRPSSAPARTI
jgi:predicted dehydrogenase